MTERDAEALLIAGEIELTLAALAAVDPELAARYEALFAHIRRVWQHDRRYTLPECYMDGVLILDPTGEGAQAVCQTRGGDRPVTLCTPGGQPVTHLVLPPFKHLPEVIRWGQRTFQREPGTDFPPVYTEVMVWTV